MYKIDPTNLDLVREFRKHPFGPYSHECLRMLNVLRSGPVEGRYVLVTVERHRAWALGRLPGERGHALELVPGLIFTDRSEAEWAVFKRRWQEHTGSPLDEHALNTEGD